MVREFNIDSDSKEVKEILESSFNTKVSFRNYKKGYSNKEIYVLENRGSIVGVATLIIIDKFIHDSGCMVLIEDVAIKQSNRSNGYGSIIVNDLVGKAKNRDCYKIILNCEDSLVKFYEKLGFKRDGNLMRIDV